jgi:hypothetical protein
LGEGLNEDEDSGTSKKKKKAVVFTVGDLEDFYCLGDRWVKEFLPTFIERFGVSETPWDFPDTTKVIQEVRDEVYSDTEHVVDEKGPVWALVSVGTYLLSIANFEFAGSPEGVLVAKPICQGCA